MIMTARTLKNLEGEGENVPVIIHCPPQMAYQYDHIWGGAMKNKYENPQHHTLFT
jgi:hypothetical protein